MNKMLDLSCYIEKTIDLKMPDGKILSLPKPTQKIAIFMMGIAESSKASPEDAVKNVNDLTTMILNTNKQGFHYSAAEIANMPLDMQYAIIREYNSFLNELISNPN